MSGRIGETHDPALRSWVGSANEPGSDFPVQNLPFGIFQLQGMPGGPRPGVAIGDRILDLSACHRVGFFTGEAARTAAVCGETSLNRLMAMDSEAASALRRQASELLREGDTRIQGYGGWETRLVPAMADAELFLPVNVGDYTDFYASVDHATNVGRLFRPDHPLMPNYKYLPVGYHGRASSIVASPTPVRRPSGQIKVDEAAAPVFRPSAALDYEVELGFLVGIGNALGEPVEIQDAERHLFGLCLVNDWSARDIQKWEYQPLGPFLAKSFATSLAPWIITMEALEPYRVPAYRRPDGDPPPAPYLDPGPGIDRGGVDVTVEVYLSTGRMRRDGIAPVRLSRGYSRDLYWTPGQLLTHHTSNGCNLCPGDLLASGTVSGPSRENQGCLLELTRGGREPITTSGDESRRFLEDGDEVILRGYCEAKGFVRIGLGECHGRIVPAQA